MAQQSRVLAVLAKGPSLVLGIQRLTIAYNFRSRKQNPLLASMDTRPPTTTTTMGKHADTHTNTHIHVNITFVIKMRSPD